MNSVQESKHELEAAIRYAENAISSAKQTIESMEFRQEMAKKQYSEQTGREQALQVQVKLLEERIADMTSDMVGDASTIKELRDIVDRMGDDATGDSVTINQLRRDLTVKTSQAEAWRKEYEKVKAEADELRSKVQGQYDDIVQLESEVNALEQPEQPTMPVIPKAVAIAIFREGMAYGAGNVCDELGNSDDLHIEETGYTGPFEVSFSEYIDLSDHLDLDYLRSKAADNSDEEWVVDCLKDLCASNEFECRIHGVDDEAKDSASA